MARERQREAAEISIRERLAERGLEKVLRNNIITVKLGHPRSSLIRVYTVCHSVCMFWPPYSVKTTFSIFRIITAIFGCPNF